MSYIRGNFNFSVKAIDRNTIVFQDLSDWSDDPGTYDIDIYKPAEEGKHTVTVKANQPVKIDNIGGVPDGIYTIETSSSGLKYKRRAGLFFRTECCIKKAYSLVEARMHPLIDEANDFLKMAKCAVDMNNFTLANDLFDIAQDKIERVNCNCGC